MSEENLQNLGEKQVCEMLIQILKQIEATTLRLDSLEKNIMRLEAKVNALAKNFSALRSQMDSLASELL